MGTQSATSNLKPAQKLALRSEAHTLRLANSADLPDTGGGQRSSAGDLRIYRTSQQRQPWPGHGIRDLSADYQFTRNLGTTLYYGHAWGKGGGVEYLSERR